VLSRDARHLALEQVGSEGQQGIAAGTVLIIGAGGIGCASAAYLASSGVGHIRIADFDTVDATNLGRQILYTPGDIDKRKSEVAASRLQALNPDIKISAISERLQGEALIEAVATSDLVLDGCDNFATRFQVNDACVAAGRRLISGSAIRMEGQLAVFGPDYSAAPCYRCLYTEADESMDSCAGNGVLSPVPGVIGAMMAVEALKYFAGIESDTSSLHLYDAAAT
jgi:adenylyltransferase/sulfurtransferase